MDFVAKLPCKFLYFGGIFFSERDSLIPLGTPLLALLFLRIVHCVSQGDGVGIRQGTGQHHQSPKKLQWQFLPCLFHS